MKHFQKLLPILIILAVVSCKKDDGPIAQTDPTAEELESQELDADFVSNNVVIAGANKNTGEMPESNDGLTADFAGSDSTALLNEGFKINLNNVQARGAYLRFRTISRTSARYYFDIDLESNLSGKGKLIGHTFKSVLETNSSKNESTLDIDFGAAVIPGKICYEISLYDNEGNISTPQEICLTIQSWGGNDALIGNWNLEKQELSSDGNMVLIEPGVEQCEDITTITCENQDTVTSVNNCKTTDTFDVTFKNDGTYTFESTGNKRELDHDLTQSSCFATYTEYDDIESGEGNWAYVEDENRLTLIQYKFNNTDRGETESGTLPPGAGEIIFDGNVTVDENSLIIITEDGENTFKIFLKK